MPTRYLKPGICDSDSIDKCSPLAENLFYRLLVNVDDYGRLDARPAVVRSKCFPLKDISNIEVSELLSELRVNGLVLLYSVGDQAYLQMNKWDNIPRSKESKCPPPSDDCIQVYATACTPRTVLPVTVTVTETETVNRKPEQKQKPQPDEPAFILPDWIDSDDWDLWLKTRRGKKMIPAQLQAQVNKLDGWRCAGLDHAKALKDSATNGWTGLFEPKPGKGVVGGLSAVGQRAAQAGSRWLESQGLPKEKTA